ncbi:RNA-binding protein 8A [Nadsonia fulvescens var. elongata DSM 6958]|uniref:RNA-binding protein 8A n=1 Tax=Nadsonia fulvescens var. elongata DSM 6958 TaxID=857566 RepID=A0A1E3PKY3_9ASCO|nr:RNA-binding protein 8A [Nadsonia fulvescens var. elongata DSM 6958]
MYSQNANTQVLTENGAVAVKSVEGWIVIASNINEEASEEDISDFFGEFGEIQNLHLNLDRRTGYVKGYALIEYQTMAEAKSAVENANGEEFLDQKLMVDFAFVKPPGQTDNHNLNAETPLPGRRERSKSPTRRF